MDDGTVFLSNAGELMALDYLTRLVATQVTAVQMLGNADLKTTQSARRCPSGI